MTLKRICDGAKTIADQTAQVYDLWRQGDMAGAAEVAEQIVEDCRTLTRQAEVVLAQLRGVKSVRQ